MAYSKSGQRAVIFCAVLFSFDVFADNPLQKIASWKKPSLGQLQDSIKSWPTQKNLDSERLPEALAFLDEKKENNHSDTLDLFIKALSIIDPEIKEISEVAENDLLGAFTAFEQVDWIYKNEKFEEPLVPESLRTWIGRKLVQNNYYDEALPVLEPIEANFSADPSAVLFYRAVCEHALLKKTEALADLNRLLENEETAPIRFARTAKMMRDDLLPLKEGSLDEVSRLMSDITRRLDLGRANEEVQAREQLVIAKLDKLIEKLEQEQKDQQQQQQQGEPQQSSGKPSEGQAEAMQDSKIAGANGDGDVDQKSIEDSEGWGNLPSRDRAESLQQIGRDLPTHYREAIEAYFRKMATNKP